MVTEQGKWLDGETYFWNELMGHDTMVTFKSAERE
jgi:hypothetical protein